MLTAVNSEKVITHVAEGTADIGFIEGPRQPIGLRSMVIGHDRLALVVAPGHPWTRRRRGVSAAEVAGTPLVSREGGSGTRDTLAAALAAALGPGTVQAPAALSLSTTAAVRSAVLAKAAPAVISELAVADELAAGGLVEIQTPELDLRRALRVIWTGKEPARRCGARPDHPYPQPPTCQARHPRPQAVASRIVILYSRRPPADCSRRPIGAARYYRRRAKMTSTMMTMTTTVPIPI